MSLEEEGAERALLEVVRQAKTSADSGDNSSSLADLLREISACLRTCGLERPLPSEYLFGAIIELCCDCVLRPLSSEELISTAGPNWETLGPAYALLQRLVCLEGCEHLLRACLSERAILGIMENFNSADQRERDRLKVVLHRIYCRCYVRRPFMRKRISDLLLRHVLEENVVGVKELLELYGCIASGFWVPIRDEHLVVLEKVLLPLHKVEDLNKFHKFLTYCEVQFLYKDGSLAERVVAGLLHHWPRVCTAKEKLFLQEVQDLLQVVEPHQFRKFQVKLLSQISKCVMSSSYQVSERSLLVLADKRVLSLCLESTRQVFPVLLPALMSAPKSSAPGKVLALLSCLRAADPDLFAFLAGQDEILRVTQE